MNYICLAAGKGTRFNGLGCYLQKCMYPIAGVPFLQFSLENLTSAKSFDLDTDRIIIITGHLGEQIKSFFGTSFRGARLNYVDQERAAGTGHAVLRAYQEYPFDAAIVWLADTFVETQLFDKIRDFKESAVLTVAHHVCDREHGERISFSEDGLHIKNAWKGHDDYVEIGLWKVPSALITTMLNHKADEYRYLPVVDSAIEQGLEVAALRANEWIHLGGTEPGVTENLVAVTEDLMNRREAKDA